MQHEELFLVVLCIGLLVIVAAVDAIHPRPALSFEQPPLIMFQSEGAR